ncbi:hypothetical protein [Shigella phage ESh36]|nr:hypothetical protein [Shigella phage ESh36]
MFFTDLSDDYRSFDKANSSLFKQFWPITKKSEQRRINRT